MEKTLKNATKVNIEANWYVIIVIYQYIFLYKLFKMIGVPRNYHGILQYRPHNSWNISVVFLSIYHRILGTDIKVYLLFDEQCQFMKAFCIYNSLKL